MHTILGQLLGSYLDRNGADFFEIHLFLDLPSHQLPSSPLKEVFWKTFFLLFHQFIIVLSCLPACPSLLGNVLQIWLVWLAIQTFVTIQFCYWLNRELKLLCLPSNLGEKNAAQGSLSKTCNDLLSWAKATMGRNQHALYQTQCMHFFTPPSLSNYICS